MKFIYLFFITSLVNAQIAITEVYANTPFSEKLIHKGQDTKHHHRGEFIELYNFTDADISLKGWYLVDYAKTRYDFPQDAILKSKEFLVVAYHETDHERERLTLTDDYFPTFFPSVIGKTGKIYYQSNILLRNDSESISLRTNNFNGIDTDDVQVDKISYYYSSTTRLHSKLLQNQKYYSVEQPIDSNQFLGYSFQYPFHSISSYGVELYDPNFQQTDPLTAINKPKDQKYVDAVKETLYKNYNLNQFTNGVDNILNNKCVENIPLLEQTPPTETYQGIRCFTYDAAGNNTQSAVCTSATTTPPPTTNQFDENTLNEIVASIEIAPNPLVNPIEEFTVFFKGTALGKVNSVQVVPADLSVAFPVISTTSTTSQIKINLGGKSGGVYVVRITLTTGQVLTKSLIKI